MPVNYNAFYVDPSRTQREGLNAMANAAQFAAGERQRAWTRGMGEKQDARTEQAKQMQLMGIQAETIGKALDSVVDEQSHQAYKSWLGELGRTPLGQGEFFRRVVEGTPNNFDKAKVDEGKRLMSSLVSRSRDAKGDFTLGEGQVRFTAGGQEIARGPKKTGASSGKDYRSPFYKEVQDYARVHGVNERQAWSKVLENKTLGERMRLYNNEIKRLDEWFTGTDKEKEKEIKRLKSHFGVTKMAGVEKIKEPEPKKEFKPITPEQALDYIKKASTQYPGLSREELITKARELAEQDGLR